jgi:hypothetical protein
MPPLGLSRFGGGRRAVCRPLLDFADLVDLVAVQSHQQARRFGLLLGCSTVDFDEGLSAGLDRKRIRAAAVGQVAFRGEERGVARRLCWR